MHVYTQSLYIYHMELPFVPTQAKLHYSGSNRWSVHTKLRDHPAKTLKRKTASNYPTLSHAPYINFRSVVACFPSEAAAICLLRAVSSAAGRHEVAHRPRYLELHLPPLRRRPLLLAQAAAAAAAVLVLVLHRLRSSSCSSLLLLWCVLCAAHLRKDGDAGRYL